MALAELQVRILHAGIDGTVIGRAEQIGETEIGAAVSPLVVERSFVRGDDAAAALDEFANLVALARGESGDIREDQNLEWIDVCRIEQSIVHHLEWMRASMRA